MALTKFQKRNKIRRRIRKTVSGTTAKPRLSVYRSNEHIYAQLVDDSKGETLAMASSLDKVFKKEGTKSEQAKQVGDLLAKKATEKGVEACAFDRGGYRYHGRVKSLADGAREGGLKF
jgi:large subunit ribosomal protein L18